jgi:hypothetical protein
MIIFPDPGLCFYIDIPRADSQVPKILRDLTSNWKTKDGAKIWGLKGTNFMKQWWALWLPKKSFRIVCTSFNFSLEWQTISAINATKDTTPKNLFLLEPPKDKMFSMPPPKIITLSQMPLLIGWLTVPWVWLHKFILGV